MIHKNRAATDYQFLLDFTSTTPVAGNTQYTPDGLGGTLQHTWGLAYSMGVQGWQANFLNKPGTPQYDFTIATPWGSATLGPTTGILNSGYARIYVTGYKLVVNSDCTFTVSFSGFDVYVSESGSAETHLFTYGAWSYSGSGYDERLNSTELTPYITVTSPMPPTLVCGATNGTWDDSVTVSGGYEYLVGGTWVQDAVTFDTSAAAGTCSCLASLPSISGSNSYDVSLTAAIATSVSVGGSTNQGCPGCSTDFTWWNQNSTWMLASETVTIKAKTVLVGNQLFENAWTCTLSPGGFSSNSSSTTSTPTVTTCASTRKVSVYNQQNLGCYTPHTTSPGCTVPCWPTGYSSCQYVDSAEISWPTLPPCLALLPGAVGYDVANALRHVRTFIDPVTGTFWIGCAGNQLPQAWTDHDSGIPAVWARPRFQDLGSSWPIGVFFGDGVNCTWARTYDEGTTWVDTTTMGTAMIGDFEEGANGLRWLFKVDTPDSGVTYDVYNRLLDSQLNVIRDWTVTNLTGIDNAPIACRESPVSDGSWRIGVLYSIGSVETLKFSNDGLNFS